MSLTGHMDIIGKCRETKGKQLMVSSELKLQLQGTGEIQHLKEMAKIRMCAYSLNIESGIYKNTKRSQQTCTLCDTN